MDTALEGSGEVADGPDAVNGGEEDSGKGWENKGEGSLMEGIVDGLMKGKVPGWLWSGLYLLMSRFAKQGPADLELQASAGFIRRFPVVKERGKNVMDTVRMMKAGCTAIVRAHRGKKNSAW